MNFYQQKPKQPTFIFLLLTLLLSLSACTTIPDENANSHSTIERARIAYSQKDYGQTLILLNTLVQQNSAEAQYALGYMYRYGQGLSRNQERASYWITLAAKNGCIKAQTALTLMRLKGDTQKAFSKDLKDLDGSCTGKEEK